MQKLATLLVLTTVLAAGASAQSYKTTNPFSAELGLYIPTFDGGSKSVGLDVGLGYDVYKMKNLTFSGVARYQYFTVSSTNVNLYSYGAEANFRPTGAKFYGGLGLLAITADADGSTVTKGGYSIQAGYDITEKLTGFVRFQNSFQGGNNGYEGVTVGVGYRF